MSKLFLGIDPGKKGAVALIDENQKVIALEDCPSTEKGMVDLIYQLYEEHKLIRKHSITAAIEHVHSMPKDGRKQAFTFGRGTGIWIGALLAFEIPLEEVSPQKWQKGIKKKSGGDYWKISVAQNMFPLAKLSGPRGGRKEGRADALLIADWKRRN